MSNTQISFEQLPQMVSALNEKMDLLIGLFKDSQTQPASNAHCMMSISEASAFLGKAVPTFYAMTYRKEIPFCKKGNKLYFFEDELKAWVEGGGTPVRTRRDRDREERFKAHQVQMAKGKHRKPKSSFESSG